MKRLAIGLAVACGLAVATPASATRWLNLASPADQPLYLSVAGGVVCQPDGGGCYLPLGQAVILWGPSSPDQEWRGLSDGTQHDHGQYLSVRAGSTAEGAGLIVYRWGDSPIGPTDDQIWYVYPAEAWGAPYNGCYVFWNKKSNLVMSVASVGQGAPVIQYHLIPGLPGSETGWHRDQFWCAQ